MKQIRVFIANGIQLAVTFLANFLALSVFFGMIEFIHPIRNRVLSEILTVLRIPCTGRNVVIFLSAACILIPVLLHRSKLMMRYALWTMGCRKPDEKEKYRLEEAMSIVCEKTGDDKADYDLYVSDMDEDNALALGDNIIAVTKGLLDSPYVSAYTIAGLMAHEVGHIKNHHNHMYLVNGVVSMLGNTVIRLYHTIGEILIELTGIPVLGYLLGFWAWFFKLLAVAMDVVLAFPENIISSRRSRQNEYEADEYACRIGMGLWLFKALEYIKRHEKEENELLATHPAAEKRLKRIAAYIVSHKQLTA